MNFLLKYLIKKHNVISFDIFDTLIERDVEVPSDIFREAGKRVLGKDYEEIFCSKRIQTEQDVRKNRNFGEVTLKEIYEALEIDRKYELMQEEIVQEIIHCRCKKTMIPVYQYALKLGKIILLVTDMYLSHDTITKILDNCSIDGYSKCYVSNEYNTNKISGGLFKVVLKDQGISAKDMIHIGDSIKADFVGSLKNNIIPYVIGRKNRFRRLFKK